MNIKESFRGALRRLAGARVSDSRRTLPLPSMLMPYGARVENMPKPTPTNLRRFAETPIARKAINTVKDRIAGMKWRIQPKNGRSLADLPNAPSASQFLPTISMLPTPTILSARSPSKSSKT